MNRVIMAAVVTAAVILLWASAANAAGVVFRYLPGSPAVSSDVVLHRVETGPFLDPAESTARNPGGWGYASAWAAEFEAPESTLWEAGQEDTNQPLGPNITAEVWVRLLGIERRHVLLTNRIGASDGFTLGLEDGLPFFEIVIGGASYRVNADVDVTEGIDFWLAATAAYSGDAGLILMLYRDGSVAAQATFSTTVPTPYVIRHPFYVGAEAGGTDEAPVVAGSITGLLYAAVVRDYVAAEPYLDTAPPFDGSTYFGLPDFHDYEIGSFELPMDQRIDTYPTPVQHKVYLPHVNDEFIPQGTAVQSGTTGEAELIYISYYHRTRDDRLRVQRSIVAEIDAATGAVRRTFRLTGYLDDSHVGGIALVSGAIYVSSSGYLERYPIPEFDPTASRYMDLVPDDVGSAPIRGKGSFVSAFNDTLWVGDYRTANEQAPYLYGYPIDASGRLDAAEDPAIYPIPRRIQGIDFFTEDGTTYVFMSRNRNSSEGEALRFRRSDLNPYSEPSWEASITLPHGIEDLSFADDGTLWSNSESGTVFYQRNVGWSSFFPFAFGVMRDGVIPVSSEQEHPTQSELSIDVYPNPASDVVTIRFTTARAAHTRVRIVDSLGRDAATLVEGMLASGTHSVIWDGIGTAQGIYLVAIKDGERLRTKIITIVR